MSAVANGGQAVATSVAAALALLLGAIPRIIGFLLILLIGWFIAGLIKRAIVAVLHVVKFNGMAERAGIAGFVRDMGVKADAASLLGSVVEWFIRLIVLVSAFDELGLPAVSAVLNQLFLWLPNLIVALVVLVIGGLVASALADLVRGTATEAGLGNATLLAGVARIAVWAVAILIAIDQIGIATALVNELFAAIVFALALATGLAFGLGGRDTAAQIVQSWYQKGQQAAPRLQQSGDSTGKATEGTLFVEQNRTP